MPEPVVCDHLDLQGATLEQPCISLWGCGAFDYMRLRRILQAERNTLIAHLNTFNNVVKAGKAVWDGAPALALNLADNVSWQLLQDLPFDLPARPESSWVSVLKALSPTPGIDIADKALNYTLACRELAAMAARVHAATCDVAKALEAAGISTPSKIVPPPPPAPWGDSALDFAVKLAKSAGMLVVAGGILVGGYYVLQALRKPATE